MKNQKGFSIIELMIALVIGVIIVGGIVYIFVSNKNAYEFTNALSTVQQNARFVNDSIRNDIQNAGYMGCYSLGQINIKNTLNENPPPFEYDTSQAIDGYNGTGSGWLPSTSNLPTDVTNMASKSDDILVVRYDDGSTDMPLAKTMPNSSATIFIKSNLSKPTINNGDILMITDCQKGALFQVTNYTNSSGGIQHNTGKSNSPGNATKTLSDSGSFSADAKIIKLNTKIYFVANSSDKNLKGQSIKSLWLKNGNAAPIELVEGVDSFQLLYGVDTDNDNIPNIYETADKITNFNNVSAVELLLTVDSVQNLNQSGPIKKSFITTFKMRNRGVQ